MKVTWRDGGSVLTSHAEWLDRIDPKNLQPGTSAPTLAAAWAGIVELYGVMHNQPSLTRFTIDEIVVEAQTTFDEFPSGAQEPRSRRAREPPGPRASSGLRRGEGG